MVGAENNTGTVTQVHCDVRMEIAFDFVWSTGNEVVDARGGAEVSQSSPELLSHSYPQVAFRFGLTLTELAERPIGKGEFQHCDNI